MPPKFAKYISDFYEKLHSLDVKYTTVVYTTVQKYTLLRLLSKAIKKISDGPALPLVIFLYWFWNNPAPLTFATYLLFWVFYHEFGIKKLFQRHRPSTAGNQKGFSFPSSHSFASGIIITICLYFSLPLETAIILFALINAINRPAVGVHYIADVIAGLGLGALAGFGWLFILEIAKVALP